MDNMIDRNKNNLIFITDKVYLIILRWTETKISYIYN